MPCTDTPAMSRTRIAFGILLVTALPALADSIESRPSNVRYVELVQPMNLQPATFASDINSHFMSQAAVNAVESEYRRILRDNYKIFLPSYTVEDDKVGIVPGGLTTGQEIAIRKDLAKKFKAYMFAKGLPQYLKSNPSTKKAAVAYEKAETYARVEVRTKDNWVFGTGINPFDLTFWARYSNSKWHFSTKSGLKDLMAMELVASRQFRTFATGATLNVKALVLTSGVSRPLTPTLKTTLTNVLPMRAENIAAAMTNTVGVEYTF
jgi:hypothetical protein